MSLYENVTIPSEEYEYTQRKYYRCNIVKKIVLVHYDGLYQQSAMIASAGGGTDLQKNEAAIRIQSSTWRFMSSESFSSHSTITSSCTNRIILALLFKFFLRSIAAIFIILAAVPCINYVTM